MNWLLIWCATLVAISTRVNGEVTNFDANHECVRTCTWPPEPRTCRYTFTVEWLYTMSAACYDCPINMTDCDRPECIPFDGFPRPILAVNRQLPGPHIQVCEDDVIEVKVWNHIGNSEGHSIHWHGIHQRGTQYMDGVSMVTQCPISPQSSFTYKFKASPAGTHWWHAHSSLQRQDGAFGALIVKEAPARDINSPLYDYDSPEHVAFIQDWSHEAAIDRFAAFPVTSNAADALLINGKGVYQEFTDDINNKIVYTPREVFHVKQGKRYRFRIINSGVECILETSVQAHTFTVISTDGTPVKPLEVERLGLTNGERYDIVLTADKDVGNYWFRVYTHCKNEDKEEFAILRYEGAPDQEPVETFSEVIDPVFLNPVPVKDASNGISVVEMESLVPDEGSIGEPDVRHYLELGRNEVTGFSKYNPVDFPNPRLTDVVRDTYHLNHNIFKFPPSPPLTQLNDIPKTLFCDADERRAARDECLDKYCSCLMTIKIELGQIVELVLVGERGTHPMHIHGNFFRVVGSGYLDVATAEAFIQLDRQGNITRKLENAVIKDTVNVEKKGYTIIRFVADNPGWWFFHCHKSFHVEDGMAVLLQVGTPSDLPPIPVNFPRCGSWEPTQPRSKGEKLGNQPITIIITTTLFIFGKNLLNILHV